MFLGLGLGFRVKVQVKVRVGIRVRVRVRVRCKGKGYLGITDRPKGVGVRVYKGLLRAAVGFGV